MTWKPISKLTHGTLFKMPGRVTSLTGKEIEPDTLLLMVQHQTDLEKARGEHNLAVASTACCVVLPDGFTHFIEVFMDMQVQVFDDDEEVDA